jgi:hypothetical protein
MTPHRYLLFIFFFFSGEFKIFSPLFIVGAAAARPTVLVCLIIPISLLGLPNFTFFFW